MSAPGEKTIFLSHFLDGVSHLLARAGMVVFNFLKYVINPCSSRRIYTRPPVIQQGIYPKVVHCLLYFQSQY